MASKVAAVGIAAVGLAIFLFLGFYVVDSTIATAQHDITVTNESFTPSAATVHSFNNSDLDFADYDSNVTVRNATGQVLDPGGNYTWFDNNGTLKTLSGGDLAGESSATVTYGYNGLTLAQTGVANTLILFYGTLSPFALLAFVALMAVAAAVLGRAA